MSPSRLVTVIAIIAMATVVQGVSGFGFSLGSMPLLAALLGVEKALAIQTTLGIVSNSLTAVRSRADILGGTAARMLAAAVCGMPVGWMLLNHVSGRSLKLLVGVVVGMLALALTRNIRIRSRGATADLVSGLISGVLSTSVGTNGPPLVLALTGRNVAAAKQRATLSACFAASNLIVFCALLWSGRIDRPVVTAVAASLPLLVLASAAGHRLFDGLQQHQYDRMVTALLFASAAVAIISALAG